MPTAESRFREPLLVERLAALLGFEGLARALPGRNVYPPYLLVAVLLVFDVGVVNGAKYFTGNEHVLLSTPTVVAGYAAFVLAAVGIRYMADGYARAITDLRVDERDVDAEEGAFERTVSLRTKLVVYAVSALALYVHVFVNVGVSDILAVEGPLGLVNQLFVWQVAYVPFVVEFALLYFGVHVLLPRRIARADIGLFYYDPRNMGGFAAVGQLLKRSYYLFTAGLLLFFALAYGPSLLSLGETAFEPGLTTAAFFTAAWLVGVASIGHSMLAMHRIMAGDRERRIRELEAELRSLVDKPFDINESSVTDDAEFADIERRLAQVRETRVYPATFTMWSQIAVSVLLPQALQMAVSATA